jgi:RNA polymerase sigma-70 factor (ECF subfamily)
MESNGASGYSDVVHRAAEYIRGEFSDRDWRVFQMSIVQNRRSNDVARELGISSAAVRKAKSRMLLRLRQQLGDAES